VPQNRPWAAREHGSHPATRPGQPPLTDRVDASMDAVKIPAADSTVDISPTDAGRDQLRSRHHTMLRLRQASQQSICPTFFISRMKKVGLIFRDCRSRRHDEEHFWLERNVCAQNAK
jgi:hypothetical protein